MNSPFWLPVIVFHRRKEESTCTDRNAATNGNTNNQTKKKRKKIIKQIDERTNGVDNDGGIEVDEEANQTFVRVTIEENFDLRY